MRNPGFWIQGIRLNDADQGAVHFIRREPYRCAKVEAYPALSVFQLCEKTAFA